MKTHREIIKKLNKLDQSMTIGMFKKVNETIQDINNRLKKLEEIQEIEQQAQVELSKSYGGTI